MAELWSDGGGGVSMDAAWIEDLLRAVRTSPEKTAKRRRKKRTPGQLIIISFRESCPLLCTAEPNYCTPCCYCNYVLLIFHTMTDRYDPVAL